MSVLLVGRAGPATSIQDCGRFGWQRYGLAPAGALDRASLAAANALVHQPANGASIEIGPFATQFLVIEGTIRFALFGAARVVVAGGQKIPMGSTAVAVAGEMIDISAARSGVFTYMSLAGGIKGRLVLDSMSVHARAGLGSPYTRPLKAGDLLETDRASIQESNHFFLPSAPPNDRPIRVILGPQEDYFSTATIVQFLTTEWKISATSDRMAYRLTGPKLNHAKGFNIVSDGTVNGSIQIPGSGQPLVLLPDRGTTGGYPKLAAIISADLGRFAQTPAGCGVAFSAVTIEDAHAAAKEMSDEIGKLPDRVRSASKQFLSDLTFANLAGGAVNAVDFDD